ncbi:MAG: S8 family serine peptidase [Sulfurovum sp.]|nr:MAG: S8 family serine peptidase [Sulfurovum sp.]
MKYVIVFLVYCYLLVFIGCGGGGGDSTKTTNYTSNPKTGIFLDSPVYGLAYKTATQSGFTNEKGEFTYFEGETIEFQIGDLTLGTVKASNIITPYTMAGDTDIENPSSKAINIAMLLQSLDSDRDGDEILDIRSLQNHKFTQIDLTSSTENMTTQITNLLANNFMLGDSNYRISITSKDAKDYMDTYINNLETTGDDPKIGEQWHLDTLGLDTIVGRRINQTYIQIVDDGFDSAHEDLKENYDESRSWNVFTNTKDPTSSHSSLTHGTRVAGIIGARGFNGIGLRGIAPYSKISGYTFLGFDSEGRGLSNGIVALEKAWLSGDGANDILVSNNSWGTSIDNDYDMERILEKGSKLLRDGKGRIYVFAAGNERVAIDTPTKKLGGNSNLSHLANNQYAIAVAALRWDDIVTNYSSPGANILVSAYADGYGYRNIVTTDKNNSYFDYFNGTSAAAPMVSGIIGLVLEACPNLTYRDVKYLLSTTSNKIDINNPTWVKNSASLWHSTDYGYGVIDASEMLSVCKNNYTNLTVVKEINTTILSTYPDINITFDSSGNGIDFNSISLTTDMTKVEWVGVYFKYLHHARAGDLQMTLKYLPKFNFKKIILTIIL